MINLYAHLSCDQKRAKLGALVCVYEQLVAGQQEASITDEGTGAVTYTRADLVRLERLISGLQGDIASCCGGASVRRRAIGLTYGC